MTRVEQTLSKHRENIVAMRRGGMSWPSIAGKLDVSTSSLTWWAQTNIPAQDLEGGIPVRTGRPPKDGSKPKSALEANDILNSRRDEIAQWRREAMPWSDIARELRLNLRRVIAWGHANLPAALCRQVRPKKPARRPNLRPQSALPLPKSATPDQQLAALMEGRRFTDAATNDGERLRVAKPVNTHTASSIASD